MHGAGGIAARFTWHPDYANRTLFDVRQELVDEIAADQRAYDLAMEAAEARESDVLASIMALDKKWSVYDMGWAEADPGQLADRILAWRWEQEKRHELIPFSEIRSAAPLPAIPPQQAAWLSFLKRLFGRD
ncbi:MAG: hypothetical protein R2853_19800 [Thermomicrobiales bacterium]|nr:hypothetical protein [Thermomicrobiales bacterium]